MEDALAFKVAVAGDAVGSHEGVGFAAEYIADLVGRPGNVPAFVTLAAIVSGA